LINHQPFAQCTTCGYEAAASDEIFTLVKESLWSIVLLATCDGNVLILLW
jgi:hypothetical protein